MKVLTFAAKLAIIAWAFLAGISYSPFARQKRLPYRGLNVLLLGNGPSLAKNLADLKLDEFDEIVAVNSMSKTQLFEEIRPTVYFLQDRYWFDESPKMANKRQATLDGLMAATWPIDIYFPRRYIGSGFTTNLAQNSNLNLHPLGQYGLEFGLNNAHFVYSLGKKMSAFVFWMWDLQIATIPSTGIVSNALFELVKCRAQSVYLVGVDMTMAADLKLSKNEAKAVFEPRHFYSEIQEDDFSKDYKVGEFYAYISSKFQTFDIISSYSVKVGCEVINIGDESILDSFPRSV